MQGRKSRRIRNSVVGNYVFRSRLTSNVAQANPAAASVLAVGSGTGVRIKA